MDLLSKKNIYFGISLAILIPGLISLILFGLKLSIDFTGGSVSEYKFKDPVRAEEVIEIFKETDAGFESIQSSGDKSYIVKTKPLSNQKNDEIKQKMSQKFTDATQDSFETVGPSVGKETAVSAVSSVAIASLAILLYIAYSFRSIPKPYSSFRFGASAIVAVLHDAFVVLGVFSILGKTEGVEINSLFITALLTVIGFSVHDTIVVFDRIRENLSKLRGQTFDQVVNYSLNETLNRSLKTSLTVVFTLFAMLLLGGESIRWFVFALLIGIVSGTFSSIFNAAPILAVWENFVSLKKKK